MSKKLNLSKNAKSVIALILVAIISIGISFVASQPEMYKPLIKSLDEKRADALALSTSAITLSTGMSLFAEDRLDPIVDFLSNITSYVTLIVCVIFLEKLLLTSFGFLTFAVIIPISCILGLLYVWLKKDLLKAIALKLTAFGLVLFLVVPSSVLFTNLIERSKYYDDIKLEATDIIEDEDISGLNKLKELTKEVASFIEQKTNSFIDMIAIMIITTCAIPLGTLALLFWIVKMLFGINIKLPKPPRINLKNKEVEKSVEISVTEEE